MTDTINFCGDECEVIERYEVSEEYVYTPLAERKAAELGLEPRKAGSIAYFGHEPLESGPIAQAWIKKGYVIKKESCKE